MNASLSGKDKQIAELLKEVNTLTDKANRLDSQLEEAKLILIHSYWSGFNEVMRQAQHFFVDKGLDFDLLNSGRFLEDILADGIEVNRDWTES